MSSKYSKISATLLSSCVLLMLAFTQPVRAKINVVATIKPVHSLVAGVMLGVGNPHLLVASGSPHTYALKPSDAAALQSADLVVQIGPAIETFLIEPLKSLAGKSHILTLADTKFRTRHVIHSEETRHSKNANRLKPRTIDPHIWLDPQNARGFVMAIATALSSLDPTHKYLYWQNTKQMIARLDRLTAQIQSDLIPVRERPYLSFHDALIYFERRFNLNYAGAIAVHLDQQPGARHLRDLQQKIKAQHITCVFSEPQFRSKLVDLVVEGANVRTASLDIIGADIEKGPELYFSLLRNIARAFLSCLGKT